MVGFHCFVLSGTLGARTQTQIVQPELEPEPGDRRERTSPGLTLSGWGLGEGVLD